MTATKLVVEPTESVPAQSVPTEEEIQLRAHQIRQIRLRDGIEGTAEQDWAQAVQECTSENEASKV